MSNTKIKILHITVRADFGGGPEHVFQLIKHGQPFWTSFVACPTTDYPYPAKYRKIVKKIHPIPHRSFSLSAFLKLIIFIRKNGIQIIHSHGKGAGLYSRLLRIVTGVPCIHTFHGIHMNYPLLIRKIYTYYEACMSLFTKNIIAVSSSEQQCIIASGLAPKKKCICIPNGVPIPESIPQKTFQEPYTFLSITRFDDQKNTAFLIPILQTLHERQILHKFHFLIVGTGPKKHTFAHNLYKEQHLMQSVTLLPPTQDIQNYIQKAFGYISTSKWEGLPLSLLESMAHALPVVATDVIGNSDAVTHNSTGLLYPLGNVDAAVDALCALIENPSFAQELGRNGRTRVLEEFSIDSMIASYLVVYSNTL